MAFQPVGDAVQSILEYGDDTRQWTNTLWFSNSSFTQADMAVLNGAIFDWVTIKILPFMHMAWEFRRVTSYDMRSVTGPKVVGNFTGFPGARTGEAAPINIACVVTMYTALRGRSGRGRNYLTGFSELDVSSTLVHTDPIVNGANAAYNDLFDDVAPTGFAHGIAQRYEAGVQLPTGVVRPVIDTNVRSALLGTQRRRIDRP